MEINNQKKEQMFKVNLDYLKSIDNLNEHFTYLPPKGDEHLQYLGVISYFIGLDFMTCGYLNKEVMKKVTERIDNCIFKDRKIDKKIFFISYFDAINRIDPEQFEEDYQNYIKSVEECIDEKYTTDMQTIILHFKRMLSSSTIDITSVYDLHKIISKNIREYTYQDILKINSTITDHLNYIGRRAVDEFSAIYSNNTWNNLLKESVLRFDRIRYGTLFNESVNTMIDCIKSGVYGDIDSMVSILCGETSDEKFEKAEFEHQEKLKSNSEKDDKKESKKERLAKIDIQHVMEKDPLHAVLLIADEANEKDLETESDFIEGIESVSNDDEYSSQVYHFIASHINKVDSTNTIGEYNIDLKESQELLSNKVNELRGLYKEHAEKVCAELNDEDKVQLNRMINDLISNVIISSMDQKQYLISQLYNPGIKTYQHLTQIMHLIETGNMKASTDSLDIYVKLYDYVKEHLSKHLDEIESGEGIYGRLCLYMSVKNVIDTYLKSI